MQRLIQDLRYALRQLRKAPSFTITAVLTLALGMGATTAIFSLIEGTLRLPFPQADRLITVKNRYPSASYISVSYPDFEQWKIRTEHWPRWLPSFPAARRTWESRSRSA
jgi:hypothetical protein